MSVQFRYNYKLYASLLQKEAVAIFLPLQPSKEQIKSACHLDLSDHVDAIRRAIKDNLFSGKSAEVLHLPFFINGKFNHLLVGGLGKANNLHAEVFRRTTGQIIKTAVSLKVQTLSIIGHFGTLRIPDDTFSAIVEGGILAGYRFNQFKTSEEEDNISKVRRGKARRVRYASEEEDNILQVRLCDVQAFSNQQTVEKAKHIAEGVQLARDLGNLPANYLRPADLAKVAKELAKKSKGVLDVKILEEGDLKELGMDLFLSVAKGSNAPAKLIIFEYRSPNARKTVSFVGKGVTFDSGGISLKPAKGMEEMKFDMCGAAAVMGTMSNLIALQPKINVIGAIAATENLPSGTAQCPGDIWKTYSGKTVEVINTDAEGRLILADTLSYIADKYQPDTMIDLATLTGACVVALGHYATAMIGNDNKLMRRIERAGQATGERVWELPNFPEYEDALKSDYADLKNIGDSTAGAISAGLFLKQFVGETKWAHLDIAGTAWGVKDISYLPKGATGVGVRLLTKLVERWSQ